MYQNTFDPDSVKKAVLWWSEDYPWLCAIELLDKKDNLIFKVGWFCHDCKKHSVVLEEGDRIVGVASFNNPYTACHSDF